MRLKITLLLLTSFFLNVLNSQNNANLPPGFTSYPVLSDFAELSCFTFISQDSLLLGKQGGEIFLFANNVLSEEPVGVIPTITSSVGGDRGLAGMAMDPDYPASPYLYASFTEETATNNRVSRFLISNGNIDIDSEEVLIDFSPMTAIWHTGGAIVFDDQGHLYTSTGDNSFPDNAQDSNTTHGKIIRINKDGSIPTDNPYYGSGELEEVIWSHGLRNPYTMSIHKSSNTIFVNNVGQDVWEEINNATVGGRNFGWPLDDGYVDPPNPAYDPPSYAYTHPVNGVETDSTGYAVTGGAFYDPDIVQYPAQYVDKYFFLDYYGGWINYVDPNLDGHDHIHDLRSSRETFATNLKQALVYLSVSPDGYLYFYSRFSQKLYKIAYYDGDPPLVIDSPDDTTTMIGNSTAFEVVALGAETLNYEWYKNGVLLGSAPNGPIYSFGNTQTGRAGDYQVRVYNAFGEDWSDVFTLDVIPFNEPPTVTITEPSVGTLYQAGQTINFSATANDLEDGPLGPEQFAWYLDFHHDTHVHDAPPVAIDVNSGSITIPDIGEISSNVFYRLIVRVEDGIGQVTEDFVDILPRTSDITFETDPAGLDVNIDGPRFSTPYTQNYVEHLKLPVSAPPYQTIDGVDAIYRLSGWSAALDNTDYVIPDDDSTLTAYFDECMNPNDVIGFGGSPTGGDSMQLNWMVTDAPCVQGFTVENISTLETFDVDAIYTESDYSLDLSGLTNGATYDFSIKAYNEYGESNPVYLQLTLGLEDVNGERAFKIYPNPVESVLIIDGLDQPNSIKLGLTNIVGQILNDKYSVEINDNQVRLDLSKLSSGVFFLKIYEADRVDTVRIIKR